MPLTHIDSLRAPPSGIARGTLFAAPPPGFKGIHSRVPGDADVPCARLSRGSTIAEFPPVRSCPARGTPRRRAMPSRALMGGYSTAISDQ